MPPKISKHDISPPTPLLSLAQAQAAAGMADVYKQPVSPSVGQRRKDGDSGVHMDKANSPAGSKGAAPPLSMAAIPPFSAGRFDSSASVAGGPNDPRIIRARLPPPQLTFRQYQSFVQALAVYRRQVQALAAAGETFVRALEEMADYVPAAQLPRPHVVGDLDFLIDSSHLISNAHQIYAENLERDFEEPLTKNINDILQRTATTQKENKVHLARLVEQLHLEEKNHKLGKKKRGDLRNIQSNLNVRMTIAEEIKRLTVESQTIQDSLSHQSMPYILDHAAAGVRAELQNYETIHEGLKKLGAFSEPASSDFYPIPQNYQTHRESRYSVVQPNGPTIPYGADPGGYASQRFPGTPTQQQQKDATLQRLPGPINTSLGAPQLSRPEFRAFSPALPHSAPAAAAPAAERLKGVPEDGEEGIWDAEADNQELEYVRKALRSLCGE